MNVFADAHSCLPLHRHSDIRQLQRHYDAGARYVSINIGMDFNPLNQIMETIASFRAQIQQHHDFILAESASDIEKALQNNQLAISFDLEGAVPLLESVDMVALYHRLGVRQIHLAYNRNNSVAGGAHDVVQGLTKLGERMVDAIHDNGILMDLSHSDERTALDICAHSGNRPVLYSHGNPRACFDHGRNVTDRAMKAVAATGGLVCLNGVATFLNDWDLKPASLVRFIDYTVQLLGIERVGIGLDFCYDDGVNDMPEGLDRGFWWPQSAGYGANGLSGRYMPPEALQDVWAGLSALGYQENDLEALRWNNLIGLIKKVWH